MGSGKPAAFTLKVKELILKRAGFKCDRCGLMAPSAHFHHRTPRRAGGSSRTDLGLPSNGLLLHPKCHDLVESHRKAAAELGFIVGYGTLPVQVPVYTWRGWAWLNHDGTMELLGRVPTINETRPEPE